MENSTKTELFKIVNGVLIQYKGNEECVTVPEGVTEIAYGVFDSNRIMTRVIFPSTLKKIGEKAFRSCINLTDPVFPEGLECIDEAAFGMCQSIEHIVLPSSIRELGRYAFGFCSGIESVTLPNGICEIPDHCFKYCGSLMEIDLPDSIERIGNDAFLFDKDLWRISLPKSLKRIENGAFAFCSGLKSVYESGACVPKEADRFISLPEGCVLGGGAFAYCYGLTDKSGFLIIDGTVRALCPTTENSVITLPAGVTKIDPVGFGNIIGELIIPREGITFINDGVFIAKAGSSLTLTDPDGEVAARFIVTDENERNILKDMLSFNITVANGRIDTADYDRNIESYRSKINKRAAAGLRLLYPYGLSDTRRLQFEEIVKENVLLTLAAFVSRRLIGDLAVLIKQEFVDRSHLIRLLDITQRLCAGGRLTSSEQIRINALILGQINGKLQKENSNE